MKLRFILLLKPVQRWRPHSKSPEEREFVVDSGASMYMLSKKDLSSDEMETLRRSRNPQRWWQPMEKCKQTKKHKYTITILISSWRCKYSMTRLLFYRLENSAKTTHIPVSGSAVKNHGWPKRWPLSVPGLSSKFWYQFLLYTTTAGLVKYMSEVAIGHLETGTIHQKQQTYKKSGNNRDSDDRLRDLPEWLEEFTHNLEDTEVPAPAHVSQDTESERPTKVVSTSRKHSVYTHFPRPKLRSMRLFAEDALTKQYLEQRSLVTW